MASNAAKTSDADSGRWLGSLASNRRIIQVAAVALCLTLARYVLGFEDVLLGSYSGSLLKFVKQRMLRRGKTGGAR